MKVNALLSVILGLVPWIHRRDGAKLSAMDAGCAGSDTAMDKRVPWTSPRMTVGMLGGALMLASCGQADEPASAPGAATEQTAVIEATPEPLDAAGLRDVCRAALAAVNELPAALIEVDGVSTVDAAEVVDLSWRAPVDGGRAHAQCRVDGDVVVWRLTNLPDPAAEVWRTGLADPIVRYARADDQVTIIQTFPDGTSSQVQVSVNAEEEAR